MRKPLRQLTRRQVSTTDSMPAPIGGWNARDPLADMKETDAILLENWFPTPSDVQFRKGYLAHATGLGSQVQSLLVYNSPTTEKIFGCAGANIYNVTAAGAVGAAVVAALTSAKWQYVNIRTSGGSFLLAANGADSILNYDGTTWVSVTGISAHAITGVTTSNIINIHTHMRRVWLVEKDTLKVWYMGIDSMSGAATAFDLGPLFKLGGYLVAMESWTIDAGVGMDDHAVFITSKGEVAVYKGVDPAAAATWALVGVYRVGEPIGRRCFVKVAGDLAVITKDGVFPMAKALYSDQQNDAIAITDKIRNAFSKASATYGTNFGWEGVLYPNANMLLFNIPVSEGDLQEQYVMNTISGSWGKFTGWYGNCWALSNGAIYYGGNGIVNKAWYGDDDNGSNITAKAKTAFNYNKTKNIKHYSMARPVFTVTGTPGILLGINTDFEDQEPTGTPTFATPAATGTWGTSVWGAFTYTGGERTLKDWQSIQGEGYCAALRLKCVAKDMDVRWTSTDIVFENGGVL